MSFYPVGVVGESFQNSDGSSRQDEIARCSRGERVSLIRDPDNPYDTNCVNVVSARGIQIGCISRDDCWIAERLDKGLSTSATIHKISEGKKGIRGVVLVVSTQVEAPGPSPEFGGGWRG